MGNIGSLNQVDLFMYIKFLNSTKVKNICQNEDSPYLNYKSLWNVVINEVTKNHIDNLDQKNLAIIAKTVSEV